MKLSKKEIKNSMLLYAVTDRTWLNGKMLAEQAEEALKGGITFLQLREKELPSLFIEEPGRISWN